MKVVCLYDRLSEVPSLRFMEEYKKISNPWSHEYDVFKNRKYCVLGIETWGFIPMMYVTPVDNKERDNRCGEEVMMYPAVLFSFEWCDIPKDWVMRISGPHHDTIEILPKALAQHEAWFERYIDTEPDAIELVNQEIERALKQL